MRTDYPPLEQVTTPNVDTPQAAFYLNRRAKTLNKWAFQTNRDVPIRPIKINGRLAWNVEKIRGLVYG